MKSTVLRFGVVLGLILGFGWQSRPAQAQSTFFKMCGTAGYAEAYALTPMAGGGYGLTGRAGADFNDDVFVVRTSASGDTLWTRRLRSNGNEYGYSICPTSDGGLLVGGFGNGLGAGENDAFLIKVTGSGDIEWAKTYGGTRNDYIYCVRPTTDGGFIAAGYTTEFYLEGGADFLLIKTDASGNIAWARTFGGEAGEQAFAVCQTSDGGFVVAGHGPAPGLSSEDALVVRTDASGNPLWSKNYGGSNWDELTSVQATSDGGLVLSGRTQSFGAGSADLLVIKTNASGDPTWTRTFGGASGEGTSSVRQSSSGGYVVAASTSSFGAGSLDGYLVMTDAAGNATLSRTFGDTGLDNLFGVEPAADGGCVLAGSSNNWLGPVFLSLSLIKTDATGSAGCYGAPAATITGSPSLTISTPGLVTRVPSFAPTAAAFQIRRGASTTVLCNTVSSVDLSPARDLSLSIRPNPASSSVSVVFQVSASTSGRVSVYRADGALVRVLGASEAQAGQQSVRWDGLDSRGRRAGPGVYFLRLDAGDRAAVAKLTLSR